LAATAILQHFRRELLLDTVPLAVQGDGNCLYRAVSRELYGAEHMHELVRLLTALEIVMFTHGYDPQQVECRQLIADAKDLVPAYDESLREVSTLGEPASILPICCERRHRKTD